MNKKIKIITGILLIYILVMAIPSGLNLIMGGSIKEVFDMIKICTLVLTGVALLIYILYKIVNWMFL